MRMLKLFNREVSELDTVLRNRLTMAKLVQENAITERIRNAEEVKILECTCKGNNEDVGIAANEHNLVAGASESNNFILKRIIVFKGRL